MASVTKTITEAVDGSGNPSVTTSLFFTSFEDFMEHERDVGVMNSVITTPASIVVGEPRTEGAQAPLTELEVGEKYRITKNLHGHKFDIGTVVVVAEDVDPDGDYKAELLDGGDYWYIKPEEVEEI